MTYANVIPSEWRLVDLGECKTTSLIGVLDVGKVIVEVFHTISLLRVFGQESSRLTVVGCISTSCLVQDRCWRRSLFGGRHLVILLIKRTGGLGVKLR